MPIYVYRCLDCGLSLDVRHSFEETYQGDCDGCSGVVRKHFGQVQISASATPTRGVHDGKAIDWKGTKTKVFETRAGNKWEVKAGHIIKEANRKKAESQLQEILE